MNNKTDHISEKNIFKNNKKGKKSFYFLDFRSDPDPYHGTVQQHWVYRYYGVVRFFNITIGNSICTQRAFKVTVYNLCILLYLWLNCCCDKEAST